MLKVQVVKHTGNGKWSLTARAIAKEAAEFCENGDEFVGYFNSKLAEMPRDSVGRIGDAYFATKNMGRKTEIVANVSHSGNIENKVVMVITKEVQP